MSWISGECQGDRDWKCYYGTYEQGADPETGLSTFEWVTWCRDVDGSGCPSVDDGGGLIKAECVRNCPPPPPSKKGW